MSRLSRVVLATAALVVLPTAAWAHPSFNPNQIPAGEPVEATLVVPHGCAPGGGMPTEDGGAVPTVEIAIQAHEGVTVEPGDVDGWEATVDAEAVTWTDAGGATTDVIELPVTVTVAGGDAGDELFLSAFQGCEGGESFRWVALPDEEGFPAVKLTLTSGSVGTEEMADMDHGDMDMGEDASEEMVADGEMADGEHDPAMAAPAETGAQALAGEPAGGGVGVGVLIALVLVGGLLFGGLVAVARGRQAT